MLEMNIVKILLVVGVFMSFVIVYALCLFIHYVKRNEDNPACFGEFSITDPNCIHCIHGTRCDYDTYHKGN